VEAVYYFTSKRSGFDRSLGKFRIWTVFYIILIFITHFYISTSTLGSMGPSSDEPIEVTVQKLVKDQYELRVQLRTVKEVLSFLLMVTGFYAIFGVGVLQQWRNERSKQSPPPLNPRPLGLDLE